MQRGSACVVFDIEATAGDGQGGWGPPEGDWTEGPLPTPLADGSTADRERRLTYFEPRVGASLFGTPERPARWYRHRGGEDGVGGDGNGDPAVMAVELLRLPDAAGPDPGAGVPARAGLAILHVRLAGDPVDALAGLVDLTARRERYEALLPPGVGIAAGARRAWSLVHVTFADGQPPAVMPAAYERWGGRDQWLWLMASRTPVSVLPPDPEDASLFAGRVRFSADWQALVLRDGAAFVGTSPDPGGTHTFHASAAQYVHTLYLDVFLLGRLQVAGAQTMANRLSALTAREADAARLLALEGELIELRRALWSSHIASRGKANELLERFQEQHRLETLLDHTGTVLADAARYVEAARARRTGLALGLLSAAGLPFGVAYAAGALWGGGPVTLLVATAVALVIAAALFVLLPPLRGLAVDTVWRRTEG